MKTTFTLHKPDGTDEVFEDKKAFDRAVRKARKQEERAEERRFANQHLAQLYACQNIVDLTNGIDASRTYRFEAPEAHCAPNGYLRCDVHRCAILVPDPTQKDFASMLGVGLVDLIVFDGEGRAVAFKHFRGQWFTAAVESGVLYCMELPKSLCARLDERANKKLT